MIARVVTDHALRNKMAEQAGTAGIEGYTWWDAMEVSLSLEAFYLTKHEPG